MMKPRFYSKAAICVLSLLFTPFFGCILLAYNLREIGKGSVGTVLIIASVFWTPLVKMLTNDLIPGTLLQLVTSNVVGSAILTFFVWDQLFLNFPEYEKKKVWKPVLVITSILAALLAVQLIASKNNR
jgi:hypothetical protein